MQPDNVEDLLVRETGEYVPRELSQALLQVGGSSEHSMVVASCHAALSSLGFKQTSEVTALFVFRFH